MCWSSVRLSEEKVKDSNSFGFSGRTGNSRKLDLVTHAHSPFEHGECLEYGLHCLFERLRPLTLTGKLDEPFTRVDGGWASRLDLLRLSVSAITLMQHGRRSVVEFTLQLVQVALPKGRVIPEDFGEGRQLTAIDLGLNRP
jgi:hypothetical protein